MSTDRTDPMPAGETPSPGVRIAAANIYLAREICDTFFPGIASVALVAREVRLLVVPVVQDSAGGTLLKVRNRHGDRVIHAQEFFRDKGFAEDALEQAVKASWSPESAALVLDGVRRASARMQT